jgi:hypothetical protein
MKIDEPKTPYEYASGGSDDEAGAKDKDSSSNTASVTASDSASGSASQPPCDELDANLLAAK